MLRRLVPASAAAALLLAGVTGCSAQQAQAQGADCEPVITPGAFSEQLGVNGAFGESPEVAIPGGSELRVSQRTTVIEAEDRAEALRGEALVGVNMAFFDSDSGEKLYESAKFAGGSQEAEYLLLSDAEEMASPLTESLRCAAPGDRMVLALSPEDGGQLAMQLGGDPAAPLVGVIDVVSTSDLSVNGKTRGLPNGYPAVTTDDDGIPGVVLAPRALPAGTESALRIRGEGDEVEAQNTVIVQMLVVDPEAEVSLGGSMNEKAVVNTWQNGSPAVLGPEDATVEGAHIRAELTGKPVGSQVVVLSNEDGASEVAVVDILGIG